MIAETLNRTFISDHKYIGGTNNSILNCTYVWKSMPKAQMAKLVTKTSFSRNLERNLSQGVCYTQISFHFIFQTATNYESEVCMRHEEVK